MSKLAKTASVAVIVVAALAAAPSGASAATHVGATFTPGTGNSCLGGPDYELLQTGRASGPSYATPSDGVLTVWSFQADDSVQTVMTLRVFRPTGTAHQYQVIADGSELKTISPSSGLHNFPTRIPVQAGDFIGIRSTTGECALSTLNPADTYDYKSGTATAVGALGNYLSSLNGWIIDISATLEPDADNDGFGDESQDQCVGQAGGSNGCPGPLPAAPSSQPVTKKKCKKHKHRSASAAKKHCKKKR